MSEFLLIPLIVLSLIACDGKTAINDIEHEPQVTEADKPWAGVFRILDGKWQGRFFVLNNENPQKVNTDSLTDPGYIQRKVKKLPVVQTILVEQIYSSLSPFFQKVTIRDRYEEPDGIKRTVTSYGVNKVQAGGLWCVVKKPDETVIHHGSTDGPTTIIWQRNEKNPLRNEYFYEVVSDSVYGIVGWGYYGIDDVEREPLTWFRAVYKKINP